MKIEIDTQRDSKEELMHLATMLRALSGINKQSSASSVYVSESKPKNIFDDPSPNVGIMGMFGDTSPSTPTYSAPVQQVQPVQSSVQSSYSQSQPSASSGLFSIFGSTETSAPVQQYQQYSQPIVESEHKTTAKDLLEDLRIQPY